MGNPLSLLHRYTNNSHMIIISLSISKKKHHILLQLILFWSLVIVLNKVIHVMVYISWPTIRNPNIWHKTWMSDLECQIYTLYIDKHIQTKNLVYTFHCCYVLKLHGYAAAHAIVVDYVRNQLAIGYATESTSSLPLVFSGINPGSTCTISSFRGSVWSYWICISNC